MSEAEDVLRISVTRAENLEVALSTLTNIIADRTYSQDARRAAQIAHGHLHAERSPETVKRMERERGLRK